MTKYKFSSAQLFYATIALIVTAGFCHLALVCYFADSEIWLLTLSQQTFSGFHLSSILYKWSFHALTYAFSHHAPSEWDVYIYARIGWTTVAVGAQLMIAYAFSSFAGNKKLLLPLFIVVMTFTAFFNQGFRIRGDILSLFAHAATMILLYRIRNQHPSLLHYAILLFFNILLGLSTPKAIYLYIAQFAFAISMVNYLSLSRQFYIFVWTSHILPILLICAAVVISYMIGDPLGIFIAVHEVVDYYLKSFDSTLSNASYFTLWDFAHIIKVFTKSMAHFAVFLCGFAIYLWNSYHNKKTSIYTCLNIYFGVLLIFIILHNQKLPFFLGTYGTPLIAYTYILTYNALHSLLRSLSHYINMLLIGAMTLLCLLDLNLNLFENNNLGQQFAIETLDAYMQKHPSTRYYDTIGILPRKNTVFLFIGPGEVSRKKKIIADLDTINPDVILYTFKFNYLEPDIHYYLEKHRFEQTPYVWVSGESFSRAEHPKMFERPIMLRNQLYRLIPVKPAKYIYDKQAKLDISRLIVPFKNGLETKRLEQADSFAVPELHSEIFQTNIEPIYFFQPPYQLFRYDTFF